MNGIKEKEKIANSATLDEAMLLTGTHFIVITWSMAEKNQGLSGGSLCKTKNEVAERCGDASRDSRISMY